MNILGESSIPDKVQLRPRTNLTPGQLQEFKRTYVKVELDSKDRLAQLVLKEGFKIKDAAKITGIKYATAKTIIFHLRREKTKTLDLGARQCGYTQLQANRKLKLNIISKTTDRVVSSYEYTLDFDQRSSSNVLG